MSIASEGYPFIFGLLIPGLALAGFYPLHHRLSFLIAGAVLLFLALACAGFFRNPSRTIPSDDAVLVSPADGRVLRVLPVEDEFVGRGYRVDIFLSVFDVHINRMPTAGTVAFVNHRPGKFISAFKDKASEDNERTDVGIAGKYGNIRVTQIAGIIARRIVCRAVEKEAVAAGQIYGLIRFGSRTEITFPEGYVPCVAPGDHVTGGETVVGRLKNDA